MSDQEHQSTETIVSSENLPTTSNNNDDDKNQVSEKLKENESNSTNRIKIPQDVRYSIEENDREKLTEKYNNYQISDINTCNIRFLTDNREKKNLVGRDEGKIKRINKKFCIQFSLFFRRKVKITFTRKNIQC